MLNRTFLLAAFLASAASPIQLSAQKEVPASLSALKPHEVVEAVMSDTRSARLTDQQQARLESIHMAVRDERHRWSKTPGNKAHRNARMQPMISQEKAYADALAVLTPAQRSATLERFNDEGYVPVVPSLASKVPTSLEGLKPHEIVQAFAAEAGPLGLSQSQVEDLGSLHVAVRDERHSYTMRGAPGKAHGQRMMEPMISRERAYNDALSYLTPGQQEQAIKLFNIPSYKPGALSNL
jgi:Spy/CpxP family protein refolding chaperone